MVRRMEGNQTLMDYVIAVLLLAIVFELNEILSELQLAKKDREDERSGKYRDG